MKYLIKRKKNIEFKNKNIKFKKINNDKIIDTFEMEKNYDFNKKDLQYSWADEDYITNFTKKSESGNIIYLVCTKRGYNSKDCNGKAKYNKKIGIVTIYAKCNK